MKENYRSHKARKYLTIIRRLLVIGWREASEFRKDLFFSTVQFFLSISLFVVFWEAIVANVRKLGEWTIGELVVLTFFISLSSNLQMLFLGLNNLPEKVRQGELDKYICRPINPLFMTCFETVPVVEFTRSFLLNVVSIGAVTWYFHIQVTLVQVILALVLLVIGSLVLTLIDGTVALLSFWTGKVDFIRYFTSVPKRFNRYPVDLLPGPVRFVLLWVVPVALIATYPAIVFVGRESPLFEILVGAVFLLLFWTVVFVFTARKALAAYEAFGG